MRQFILAFTLFSFALACNQRQNKQKDAEVNEKKTATPAGQPLNDTNNLEKKITIDSLSNAIGNYFIISPKSYFFDSPDLSKKRKDYLKKDELVLVSKIANGFAYARSSNFADSLTYGWMLLSNLKQVFFTPPKVVSGEE